MINPNIINDNLVIFIVGVVGLFIVVFVAYQLWKENQEYMKEQGTK